MQLIPIQDEVSGTIEGVDRDRSGGVTAATSADHSRAKPTLPTKEASRLFTLNSTVSRLSHPVSFGIVSIMVSIIVVIIAITE